MYLPNEHLHMIYGEIDKSHVTEVTQEVNSIFLSIYLTIYQQRIGLTLFVEQILIFELHIITLEQSNPPMIKSSTLIDLVFDIRDSGMVMLRA